MSYPSLFPVGPTSTLAQGLADSPGPAPAGAAPQADAPTPDATDPAAPAASGGTFAQAIAAASQATGLDPRLIAAVAQAESGGDPTAVSSVGAEGLMQLMPGTAQALGVQNAFDPVQNAVGGATYLKEMLQEFNGSLPLALAAYNAGPGAVQEYDGIPPYPETEAYVRGVLQSFQTAVDGQ